MKSIKFDDRLYVGEGIRNIRKVKWKLRHRAGQIRVFVITLAEGPDQLEIYHCAFLQQRYYKMNPPHIVGVAAGYDEAVQLVQRMVEDVLTRTGDCRLKDYFLTGGKID